MDSTIEFELVQTIEWMMHIIKARINRSCIREYIKAEFHGLAATIFIESKNLSITLDEVQSLLVRAHLLWSSVVAAARDSENNNMEVNSHMEE